MADFGRVTPILRVADLASSVDYYTRVLGFTLNWCNEDGNAFASLKRGRCDLFLTVGDQGHVGHWVWIAVADADAVCDEVRARGAKVRHPPTNYPWGSREVHIEDLDGNVLRLGSENKPGEPFGEWLDMDGVRWKPLTGGGWTRAD